VAASYLAFAAFVVAALRRGTMIGTCGCFGREETPPHATHVVLNLVLAGVAAAVAVTAAGAPLDAVVEHPGPGAAVLVLGAVSLLLLHAAYVDLPRALVAGRRATAAASRSPR
jgi:hypothetical protein